MSLTTVLSEITNAVGNITRDHRSRGTRLQDLSPDDINDARRNRVDEISIPGYDTPVFEVAYGKQLYLVTPSGENIMYCGDATNDNETRVVTYCDDRFIAVNVPTDALTCTGCSYVIPNTEECRATGDQRDFNTDLWYVVDRETPLGMNFTTPPKTITPVNESHWVFMQSPTDTCVWKHGDRNQHGSTRFVRLDNTDTGLPRASSDELSDPTPIGDEINTHSSQHSFPDTTPVTDMRAAFTTDTRTCFIEDVMRVEPHLDSFSAAKTYLTEPTTETPTGTDLRDQHHNTGLDSPAAQRVIDEHGYSRRELTVLDRVRVLQHVLQEQRKEHSAGSDSVDARTKHAAEELLSDVNSR